MRKFNIASLILAGLLAVTPAAFARGGAGGGGHGGGGGHFGGGHFGSAGHVAAAGHYRGWHGGHWYGGAPWWLGYPVGAGIYDYDYGYDDYSYPDTVTTDSGSTVVTVQRALENLGYYRGPIDGVVGPETVKAIRWFQTVDKLPVTGQIDSQVLKALWIS
jgi:Putative peptidoglycan binding domain